MSDETVEVPVTFLRAFRDELREACEDGWAETVDTFIPKPKPRIVAVTRKDWAEEEGMAWFDSQPSLLDVLDGAVEKWAKERARYGSVTWGESVIQLERAIREALGVSDE